ncbi:MAG: tripartite tricarboxylate transporter substrate binding protein [Betaproteobacteria bacterium]|nr:MAG: tripartite tricarboxylate transporter substrate binding protein [Betaproteobacteria bacterium]
MRKLVIAAAAAAATLAGGVFAAESYPSKPIRFVVPFAPGGSTDLLARFLAQHLAAPLGQTLVVDNRAGAGGVVGAEITARAPADGYTIMLGSGGPLTINPNIRSKVPYDTLRDFEPITMATVSPFTLVVHPSSSAKSVKELIALARANPGKLNFGSAGNGSVGHFSTEQFMALTGTKLLHVPYKGAGPAVTDLLGGRLNLMFENLPTILPHVRSGKLRMLAVGTRERSVLAPEFPTIAEEGVPGYDSATVFGVLAPAKTPPAVIAQLNREMVKILQSAEGKSALAARGLQAVGSTPQQYRAQIGDEFTRYGRIAQSAGIRLD